MNKIEAFDKHIKDGGLMDSPKGLVDIRKSTKDGVKGYMCYPLIGYDNEFFLSNEEMMKKVGEQ